MLRTVPTVAVTLAMALSLGACKKTESSQASTGKPVEAAAAPASMPAAPPPAMTWAGTLPRSAKLATITAGDADSKMFDGLVIMAPDELEPATGGELSIYINDDGTLYIRPATLDLEDEARSAHNFKSTIGTERPAPDLLIVKSDKSYVNALHNITVGGKGFNCQIDGVSVESAKLALGVCASLRTK